MPNLETMTPAAQVAFVLAAAGPGETPDIPPFLRVTKEEQLRKNAAWASRPVQPAQGFMRRTAEVDPVALASVERIRAAEVAKVNAKKEARLAALHDKAINERLAGVPLSWSTRLSRMVPTDRLLALEHMPITKALDALKEMATAIPTPKQAAKAVTVAKFGTKEERMIALLTKPDGGTLEDLAAECGWKRDGITARISGLKDRYDVTKDKGPKGVVYHIKLKGH